MSVPSPHTPWQMLIVGGGIVGAGIARDAALRGLRVMLVDQGDFASGTSSRSSRLLHGGIRYLAQGRVGLVREASREKEIVRQIAPHLVEPVGFLFPARRGSRWPLWQLRIGVRIYDWLAGGNFERSRALDAPELRQLVPQLEPAGLTGGVRYADGLTNDARLVFDTLRSAAQHGAQLRNYTRFQDAQRSGDGWRATLCDLRTGRPDEVFSQTVINAAGPWSDRLPHSHTHLRLTKGVHLVVPRNRLPIPEAVVMTEGERILFAIPWGERVILGTTDTDYEGLPEDARCLPEDAQYILAVTAAHFPEARLTPGDILSTWAGVRPLVARRGGQPADISRRHEILAGERGWFDITGGKLTTYRLMAEQLVDQAVRQQGWNCSPCLTAQQPLLPSEETELYSGILPPPVSQAAVEHFCRKEWAEHVDDIMLRRTSWSFYHPDHSQIAEQVVPWMAECLGWDADRRHRETQRYSQIAASLSLAPAECFL